MVERTHMAVLALDVQLGEGAFHPFRVSLHDGNAVLVVPFVATRTESRLAHLGKIGHGAHVHLVAGVVEGPKGHQHPILRAPVLKRASSWRLVRHPQVAHLVAGLTVDTVCVHTLDLVQPRLIGRIERRSSCVAVGAGTSLIGKVD